MKQVVGPTQALEEELKCRMTLCFVVISSRVTLDVFRSFVLHQEGLLGLGVDVG